ncbi:hypothetical protein G6F57_017061 [Rhizopus arrhizus]|nr:hypothetical protein G6F57_017061 [Rhizopus arrhizus]
MARTPSNKPPPETPVHIDFGEKRPPASSAAKEDTVMSETEHMSQETNGLSASLFVNDDDTDHESSAAISAEKADVNASEDDINRAHNNVTVAESRLERVRTLLASDIKRK